QRKRRRRITDTCQLVNHSGRILKISSSSQIYVDRKHQVLYCAIPKAACSSWKVALAQLTGKFNRSDHRQTLYVHDDAFMASIGLHQLRSFSRMSIEEIIKSYRKFIVVRHPFERLVSAFVDKFEKYNKWTQHFHHKFGRQIMHKYRQNATKLDLETGRNVTFQEFVRLITDSEVERGFRINEHWESFQNLCLPCAIPYDFVVDYDTIEEDNRNLLRGIFMVDDPEKFFPHQNANPGSAELRTLQYMRTLSESSIQRLITTYNTDFTMFNYSWPR
ncbi:hypothetical protein CAPTEDRAFT_93169, partial [Capitella teleta]|uniref:Carbohydrate sulfotransferase n=1 Tax=Capitella teleta TaxID=283909 RepID=X2BBW1_CAPTE